MFNSIKLFIIGILVSLTSFLNGGHLPRPSATPLALVTTTSPTPNPSPSLTPIPTATTLPAAPTATPWTHPHGVIIKTPSGQTENIPWDQLTPEQQAAVKIYAETGKPTILPPSNTQSSCPYPYVMTGGMCVNFYFLRGY